MRGRSHGQPTSRGRSSGVACAESWDRAAQWHLGCCIFGGADASWSTCHTRGLLAVRGSSRLLGVFGSDVLSRGQREPRPSLVSPPGPVPMAALGTWSESSPWSSFLRFLLLAASRRGSRGGRCWRLCRGTPAWRDEGVALGPVHLWLWSDGRTKWEEAFGCQRKWDD